MSSSCGKIGISRPVGLIGTMTPPGAGAGLTRLLSKCEHHPPPAPAPQNVGSRNEVNARMNVHRVVGDAPGAYLSEARRGRNRHGRGSPTEHPPTSTIRTGQPRQPSFCRRPNSMNPNTGPEGRFTTGDQKGRPQAANAERGSFLPAMIRSRALGSAGDQASR